MQNLLEQVSLFQLSSGEIAYSDYVRHYLCASYNGFEFVDLFEMMRNCPTAKGERIMMGIARYLASLAGERNNFANHCSLGFYQTNYQTLIVANALHYAYLFFQQEEFAQARDEVLSRARRYYEPSDYGDFGRAELLSLDLRDRSFFARQVVYSLVCLLRLSLVKDMSHFDKTLI